MVVTTAAVFGARILVEAAAEFEPVTVRGAPVAAEFGTAAVRGAPVTAEFGAVAVRGRW